MPEIQAEFTLIDNMSGKLEKIQKQMEKVGGSFQHLEKVMNSMNEKQLAVQKNLSGMEAGLGKIAKVLTGVATAYLGFQKIQNLMEQSDERTQRRDPSQRTFSQIQKTFQNRLDAVSEPFYQALSQLANLPIIDLLLNKLVSIFEVLYKVGTKFVTILYQIGETMSKHWEGINFFLNVMGAGLVAGVGKMILMNSVMNMGVGILQKFTGLFLGFNKYTLLLMGVAGALQGIVTLYNHITGSSVTLFGAIAGVMTALGEYFTYLFERIRYNLLSVYDILAKGVNALIAGGNFVAKVFHKEGTSFQMKVFDLEPPPNWIQFAKNTKRIAGETIENYSKGMDFTGDWSKMGSLDQNVKDIRSSLFHIEDTLLQDLIEVATSNAIANNGSDRSIINNITINNDIDNMNTTGENALGITEESFEKMLSSFLKGGMGI